MNVAIPSIDINYDFDVLIVGGGPAGISSWFHLNKMSPNIASKTLVIEKAMYPRDKVCGGAVLDWGQAIIKKLGITLEVPTVHIKNTIYRCNEKEYIHKVPNFLIIVNRYDFDFFLAKQAIQQGLQLHQQEKFLHYERKSNRIIVTTNKARYAVKVLIGADGAVSTVRKRMQNVITPRFATALEFYYPVQPSYDLEYKTNSALLDFSLSSQGLQGYSWHFPCVKNNEPMMNHGICHTRIHSNKEIINVRDLFKKDVSARNIPFSQEHILGHPVPWHENVPTLSNPQVFLVGDAAGIDPFIGGGIHLSLGYGSLAAEAIINAFDQDDFSFHDFKLRYQNHSVGKYINRLTFLAKEIYADKLDIIDTIKEMIRN